MSRTKKNFGPIEFAHYDFENLGEWFLIINLKTKNKVYNFLTTGIMNRRFIFKLFAFTLLNFKFARVFNDIKNWHRKQKFDWYHRLTRKPIYVYSWSRDCDMCEGDEVRVCKSVKDFYKFKTDFYENAEGSCFVKVIDKKEYEEFLEANNGSSGEVRDRVLEAFENGRNYHV